MKIRIVPGWGDAVPGGRNGSLAAEHEGRPVGSLEHPTVTGEGREIGSHLLISATPAIPAPSLTQALAAGRLNSVDTGCEERGPG